MRTRAMHIVACAWAWVHVDKPCPFDYLSCAFQKMTAPLQPSPCVPSVAAASACAVPLSTGAYGRDDWDGRGCRYVSPPAPEAGCQALSHALREEPPLPAPAVRPERGSSQYLNGRLVSHCARERCILLPELGHGSIWTSRAHLTISPMLCRRWEARTSPASALPDAGRMQI